jgi:hypothetical protein
VRAARAHTSPAAERSFLRDNGLSLVLAALFVVFLLAQGFSGHHAYNQERREHGEPEVGWAGYVTSSHFAEATFENWESEFLQMAMYVLLTVFLFQRGSAESNDPDEAAAPSRRRTGKDVPAAARGRGVVRRLYEHSLSLAFLVLFLASFVLHAASGMANYNADQRMHGQSEVTLLGFMGTAQFWFESFQNWQSEFLAILAMVVLSIFLREKGSPESKDVEAPHSETGG